MSGFWTDFQLFLTRGHCRSLNVIYCNIAILCSAISNVFNLHFTALKPPILQLITWIFCKIAMFLLKTNGFASDDINREVFAIIPIIAQHHNNTSYRIVSSFDLQYLHRGSIGDNTSQNR